MPMNNNTTPLLHVQNLNVHFRLHDDTVHAVRGVSFELNKGETLALVGESGSGKSVTAMSITRLHPPHITQYGKDSRIEFDGISILDADEKKLRQLRGDRIGLIFQEPMTSLNPYMRIGAQLSEAINAHYPETSAADNHDVLISKEGTVAGSAVGNPFALQLFFTRYAEAAVFRSRCKNDGKCCVGFTDGFYGKSFILVFYHRFYFIGRKFRAEAYCLLAHIFRKFKTVNRLRISGIVLQRID